MRGGASHIQGFFRQQLVHVDSHGAIGHADDLNDQLRESCQSEAVEPVCPRVGAKPSGTRFDGASLCLSMHGDQAKGGPVTLHPLKVIEGRPVGVPAHIQAVFEINLLFGRRSAFEVETLHEANIGG
jgi:hypothetical protein